MKVADQVTVPVPRDQVWASILDGQVLVRAIPGCERLVSTGEHEYDMTVTAGVASIRGTYEGHCRLSELVEGESLLMTLSGAGAPGTVDATVRVQISDDGGATTVAYDADAVVGGMVGGVGQRMLSSVSRRMAREFFDNLAAQIACPPAAGAGAGSETAAAPVGVAGTAAGGTAQPTVFLAPSASAAGGTGVGGDFVRGIAVGAGLVLIGVLAGARLGRRRG